MPFIWNQRIVSVTENIKRPTWSLVCIATKIRSSYIWDRNREQSWGQPLGLREFICLKGELSFLNLPSWNFSDKDLGSICSAWSWNVSLIKSTLEKINSLKLWSYIGWCMLQIPHCEVECVKFLKLKTLCYYTADHRETNILPDCWFPQHLGGMDQSTAECS